MTVPLFRSKVLRSRFRRWWLGYAKRFHGNPRSSYIPTLRSGRIKGVFVEDNQMLGDMVLDALDGGSIDRLMVVNPDSYTLLPTLAPVWAWIAANAKGKVWRAHRGWLFERDKDAVLFRLNFCEVG